MPVEDIIKAVLDFNEAQVVDLINSELDRGAEVTSLLNGGLIAAMDEVGRRFSSGELFVPEMLLAAQTMKAGLGVIKPVLSKTGAKPKGLVVIGTVQGDLHDIGKNLVSMMLEGAGFTVIDLGVDVAGETFVKSVQDSKADLVAMSALLTTTMPALEANVALFKKLGLGAGVLVGGAPVTRAFADKIGADGFSEDAVGAVEVARRLMAG